MHFIPGRNASLPSKQTQRVVPKPWTPASCRFHEYWFLKGFRMHTVQWYWRALSRPPSSGVCRGCTIAPSDAGSEYLDEYRLLPLRPGVSIVPSGS
jgi:hypothetical protein